MNESEALADLLAELASKGAHEASRAVDAALRLAWRAHSGQFRSGGLPYATHPVRVARVLLAEWHVIDRDVLVAALLHDAVEDTDVTLEDVEAQFGARARDLVDHVTKPRVAAGQTKAEMLATYYGRLRDGPPGALLVKAADRIDNLRDMAGASWPAEKKRTYAAEALDEILPLVEPHWPRAAMRLRDTARKHSPRSSRSPWRGASRRTAAAMRDDEPACERCPATRSRRGLPLPRTSKTGALATRSGPTVHEMRT